MMYLNVWTKAEETSGPKLMSIWPHGEDIEISHVKGKGMRFRHMSNSDADYRDRDY